jgi:hypothetical protein
MASFPNLPQPRQNWTPWLVMRSSEFDAGLRPLAPGTRFWEAPDISVESSDPSGNPVVGEDNFVHAGIWNIGAALAAPVQVDFYWANPSLGIDSGDCNPIGSEWLQIPTRAFADVRCHSPWRPVEVNGGHECLVVNCTNYILDPILYPFAPQVERHSAQRNVHVVSAHAAETVGFALSVTNLFPIATAAAVSARIEHLALDTANLGNLGKREVINQVMAYGDATTGVAAEMATRYVAGTAEARLARRLARGAPQAPAPSIMIRNVADQRSAASLRATLACEASFVLRANPGQHLADLLLAADKLAGGAGCPGGGRQSQVAEASLQPFEQRSLDLKLSVPPNSQPGDFLVFHFTQTAEGLTIGGYTVIVQVI